MTLTERINELVAQHGSLRAAARVLDVDEAYLFRLKTGEKDQPGDVLLRRMKTRRVVTYERIDAPSGRTEGEVGGVACNLFKRLGGTDAQWVESGAIRDRWTAAVDELLRHANGVIETVDAAQPQGNGGVQR